jgi:hypothetical protein
MPVEFWCAVVLPELGEDEAEAVCDQGLCRMAITFAFVVVDRFDDLGRGECFGPGAARRLDEEAGRGDVGREVSFAPPLEVGAE